MSNYSITQLEKLTGIKAHTIRIWEQRYHLLKPERTDSNIRMYNDEELRKLLNTSLLINNGHKISKIASYSSGEISEIINKMILNQESSDLFSESIINQLISSAFVFNEVNFEKYFSMSIAKLGLNETYTKIIHPMLVKLGMMWTTSELSPAQEHFITNLVRQKFFAAIDSLPIPSKAKRKWVLFLPEEEDHETGLLLACFILKKTGHQVIYLGPKIPYESLKEAIYFNQPTDALFFLVKHQPKKSIQMLIKNLEKDFKNTSIVACGKKEVFDGIKNKKKLQIVTSVEQFNMFIK